LSMSSAATAADFNCCIIFPLLPTSLRFYVKFDEQLFYEFQKMT
jgi:hypothetical protein